MRYMALRMRRHGFDTVLIDYPSRSATIEGLVAAILPQLDDTGPINIVGHSLGGVLAKHIMLALPAERRGRIVQLGSPNFGSEIARTVDIFEPYLGPVLEQLEPNEGIDDHALDIGAVAGTAAPDILGALTGIDGENDGKVSVRSAWGNAPEDKRIAFPVGHGTMMFDDRVIAASINFLRFGKFDPS